MLAFSAPLGYRPEMPIKRPKLDGFTEVIDAWLEADKAVHRKQRQPFRSSRMITMRCISLVPSTIARTLASPRSEATGCSWKTP